MFESPFQEREYFVINMTCDADFVRYAPSIDACVLILDVTKKVPQKIKNLLKLAQQTCLFKVVVFLDNCDKITDAKQFKTILADIRKLLLSYKLDGSNAPIIRGSLKKAIEGQKTWLAKIEDFVKACDEYIKAPTRREMFRKSIDEALPGDNIGVLLRGASKTKEQCGREVGRGIVIEIIK
jgi:elongation factor Tu